MDPGLIAKLKGTKSDKLTLGELTDIAKKGLHLDDKDGKRLLAALRLMNQTKLANGAGKSLDPHELLRALTEKEISGLLSDTKGAKFPVPPEVESKLREEFKRVFKKEPPTELSPKQVEQLITNKDFNPKTLSKENWSNLLGSARVANATERGDRFAVEEKQDALRDALGKNGIFSLPWEQDRGTKSTATTGGGSRGGTQGGGKASGGGKQSGGHDGNFTPQRPLGGRSAAAGGASGGRGRLQIPPGVELSPDNTLRVPIDLGDIGDGRLTKPELDSLRSGMKPGGFSLQMRTQYTGDPNHASLCQGTVVDEIPREPTDGQKTCTYVFATAAHCVRDKKSARLSSLEIQGFGEITSLDKETRVDSPPADFAMIVFTKPMEQGQSEPCRTDIPKVPLAKTQVGSETPVLVEGRRMLVAKASPSPDNTLVELNLRDPNNDGLTIEHGDSGGGIYRMKQGCQDGGVACLELVAVVSSKPTDEDNFWGLGFGASQSSLNFANNIIDRVHDDRLAHSPAYVLQPADASTHLPGIPIATTIAASQN